jgi:tRNA(fMet)-specific endonuclease VapC
MGLIADSGVFIRVERAGQANPLAAIPPGEEAGISTITLSELLEGVQHAVTAAIAERRRARVDVLVSKLPVFPFTAEIAELHAKIRADLRKRGETIGAHDLIIAATALHLGWPVLTTNAKEFMRVPGLVVISR